MPRPTIIEFADSIARVPGFEALTPPWRATLRLLYGLPLEPADVDFLTVATHRSRDALASYAPGRFTELWARVGRRGRKSSVAVLIAVYEALFGDHESHIVPGEIALIPVISKDLSGSETVRRFEHSFLDALGIGYRETRFGNVGATVIDGLEDFVARLRMRLDQLVFDSGQSRWFTEKFRRHLNLAEIVNDTRQMNAMDLVF